MKQLASIDLARLKNDAHWIATVGANFAAQNKSTLLVDIASQLGGKDCRMRARMHGIALPTSIATRRGTLPGFPHMRFRWQNIGSECCGGLELSGECTKQQLLALLRSMYARGFSPGTDDLMIFFHEPSSQNA